MSGMSREVLELGGHLVNLYITLLFSTGKPIEVTTSGCLQLPEKGNTTKKKQNKKQTKK